VSGVEPRLHDLNDVAARMRVSRRTVEKYIAAGLIPSVKLGGRRLVTDHQLAVAIEQLAVGDPT
jgi:excisionase family DNA binding protein